MGKELYTKFKWVSIFIIILSSSSIVSCSSSKSVVVRSNSEQRSLKEPSKLLVTNEEKKSDQLPSISEIQTQLSVASEEKKLGYDYNPIDNVFAKKFKSASSTIQMNEISNLYFKAWKNEWNNVIDKMSQLYKQESHKKTIEDYRKSFEEFSKKSFDVEMLNWTDDLVENAYVGSGGPSAASIVEANCYKKQVLYLIEKYSDKFRNGYEFLYKEN